MIKMLLKKLLINNVEKNFGKKMWKNYEIIQMKGMVIKSMLT